MYLTNNVIQILVAIGSCLTGVFVARLTMKRDSKADIDKKIEEEKKNTEVMTTISIKLDNINNNVSNLTFDVKDLKNDIKNQDSRLVKVEEGVQFAHERLDKIEGGR
ncbi:hypothetical protein AXY43_23175 [Clostridium sp. MF28]|uniref:hypothetical protein n=1 Tax=Clostridium TaxID=1485 RepID=UPI000CFA4257|nr:MULTISPECIES: hypothetical protein [Clostridium]AVK50684.1 hypothetical protein AXY43_23175 [Clostridium sp. MF28]PSM58987.1 hypothetical protein C4L39_03775 [Clostridium diolis]